MKDSIYVLASLSLVLAGAACSPNRAEERPSATTAAESRAAGGGDMVKVEGCMSGSPDGRLVVTAAPDPLGSAVARAGNVDSERDTHSYVLVGGDNLQQHIGKRVEVTGTLIGKEQEVEQAAKAESQSPRAGGAGDKTATVKTTEAVDIEVKQLQVAGVRGLSPTCQVTP